MSKKSFSGISNISGIDQVFKNTQNIPEVEPGALHNVEPEVESGAALHLTLSLSLKREIKRFCVDHDMTIKNLIIESVETYIRNFK